MKRISFLLLSILLCSLSCLAQDKELIDYQISSAGVATQGTYLVNVTITTKKKTFNEQLLSYAAVHGVLFRGCGAYMRPLAGSPMAEQQHADFYNDFFGNGMYVNYTSIVPSTKSQMKSGKNYKTTASVQVMKDLLRKDLENAKVLKSLITGF